MKSFLLCLMAITGSMTVANNAVAQDRSDSRRDAEKPRVETGVVTNRNDSGETSQSAQSGSICCKTASMDTIHVKDLPQELLTLNGLKYMLSQGASIGDIQRGIYIVGGKKVQVK